MKTPEKTRCESCIIRQFNALKAFSKEELKVISDNKITKDFKKGEQIFKEGEKLNGVFCVRDGASKLSKLSENGKHQIVKIAKKGEILGQRSVVADEQTNLSATALNDTSMCYIPKQLIHLLILCNYKFHHYRPNTAHQNTSVDAHECSNQQYLAADVP